MEIDHTDPVTTYEWLHLIIGRYGEAVARSAIGRLNVFGLAPQSGPCSRLLLFERRLRRFSVNSHSRPVAAGRGDHLIPIVREYREPIKCRYPLLFWTICFQATVMLGRVRFLDEILD